MNRRPYPRTGLRKSPHSGSAKLVALLAPAVIFLAAWWWFDARQTTAAPGPEVDVAGIRARVATRYAGADDATLLRAHRALAEREPALIERLHGARLSTARYTELEVPRHVEGTPVEYPKVPERAGAHGLVRVHLLDDGRYVKTEINLAELGGDAAWAVEMAWLDAQIAASR
ncbi:MAG: hypothetical protein AAFU73_16790 [Planctomycetota bacterium]